MVIRRFEIYWINLDPIIGREIQKTRPAVIISPDVVNSSLGTVIIAPVTSSRRNFPTRIKFTLNRKESYIVLDQIRAVDKSRISRKISKLTDETAELLCERLQELFAY